MKKWIIVCLMTCIALLAGCGIQSVEQYEQMQEEQLSQETQKAEPQQPIASDQTDQALAQPKQTQQKEQSDNTQQTVEDNPSDATTTEQPTKDEQKTEQSVTNNEKQKPATNAQAPSSQQQSKQQAKPAQQQQAEAQAQTSTQPTKRSVTISIQVQSLLKNMDKLHPSLRSEEYVPSSGYILTPKTYELLSEDDTVWTILQRAVREYNIQLEYEGAKENIYNNIYIEGINHLYEFSAGSLSGWMYSVNGTFPSYGCSQYVLQDGDVIEWHYTVDLGRDLGADGA